MKKLSLLIILVINLIGNYAQGQTFPECQCAGYDVQAGVLGQPLRNVTNGSTIVLQQGQDLGVLANLICRPDPRNPKMSCCKSEAWELLDLTTGTPMTVLNWNYNGFPSSVQTGNLKCDRRYQLVLVGRCGCKVCENFIINFTIECDCCKNLTTPTITSNYGNFYCLTKPCDQDFVYTAPDYGAAPTNCPVKYQWEVTDANGNTITFLGQTTPQIKFNCSVLRAGTYTIKVTVYCKKTSLSASYTLEVCQKPNPDFVATNSSSNLTSTLTPTSPTAGCMDYWYLVKDDDKSGNYTPGETYVFQTGSPVTFSGLVYNQFYTAYHFIYCRCGNTGAGCWSSIKQEIAIFPPDVRMSDSHVTLLRKMGKTELNSISEIPAAFWKELPKEMKSARNAKDIKD